MISSYPLSESPSHFLSQKNTSAHLWHVYSWKQFPIEQQPSYDDPLLLSKVIQKLELKKCLVSLKDIYDLKSQLAMASVGHAFVLQAGDCAERFEECTSEIVSKKVQIILDMKKHLEEKLHKSVIPIGRMAGQYAKPRSQLTETIGEVTLSSFRGDIVHDFNFTIHSRRPNPFNMLKAYKKSALTLKYIDSCSSSQPFFISHESLLLDYESALTRFENDCYFNASAHMVWLGERTRDLNGAHVEYLRGIINPIGLKISHKITPAELVDLIKKLNPNNEAGKIILIPRLGVKNIKEFLPLFIQEVKKSALSVTWLCDPMHGNGEIAPSGLKTRSIQNIQKELEETIQIHQKMDSILAGVHLEISAENVTECYGSDDHVTLSDLHLNYKTACDPRLNAKQSFDLINLFK